MPPEPRSILITGASSGIGRQLALTYARAGVHLALIGRNHARLAETAAQCAAAGAVVATGLLDVRAHEDVARWVRAVDDDHPLDLAIASAGITAGIGLGRLREDPVAARAVIATNFLGTVNTIDPVVERMCMRGRGHIALLGSIAGFRGLPQCPAYCASKAAIYAYGEALRGMLAPLGIAVSVIAPGFVATPLNEDIICPKPLLMTTSRAAQIIRRGLDRRAPIIVFPRLLQYGLLAARLLPQRLVDLALARVHVDIPEYLEPELE